MVVLYGITGQISITDLLSKRNGMVNLDGRETNGGRGMVIHQCGHHIINYYLKKKTMNPIL